MARPIPLPRNFTQATGFVLQLAALFAVTNIAVWGSWILSILMGVE